MACTQILTPMLPSHFGKTSSFLNRRLIAYRSSRRRSQHGLVRSKSDLDILINTNLWESLTPPRSSSVTSPRTSTSTDDCGARQGSMTSPCFFETDTSFCERNQQQRKRSLQSIQSFTKRYRATPSPDTQKSIQASNNNTNSTVDISSAAPNFPAQTQTVPPTPLMQHTTTTSSSTTTRKSSCTPLPRIKSAPARLTLKLPSDTQSTRDMEASTMPRKSRSKSLSERRGFKLLAIAMPCDVKNNEDTREDTATQSQRDDLFTKATQLLKTTSSNSSDSNSPICNPCEMYQQLQATLHPNVSERAPSEWAAQELMQYMESSFAM
eukprot:m.39842 g.39842  ORF g.39842 m.39842 type:complete len:323 (+) comp18306_c1_seq1:706-1674(+)